MKAKDVIKMFEQAAFKGRHGDVVIVQDATAEAGDKLPPVLAEGEVTGHAHRVAPASAKRKRPEVLRVADEATQRLLRIAKGAVAKVDHEEHTEKRVPAGQHRIGIQAQWTPEGLRRVVD
jgi:hypothetical protein